MAKEVVIMNEEHHDSLKMYVNDVIAVERDIVNAIEGQLEDDRVKADGALVGILQGIVAGGKSRISQLKELSEAEGGSLGATVKEAAMSVTGVLAGLYGKLREHPVSRMVRDDRIAMNVVETSYAMLYTFALGVGHTRCAELALVGLNAAPPQVLALTDVLPGVILSEIAKDAPLVDPFVETKVIDAIHSAWRA